MTDRIYFTTAPGTPADDAIVAFWKSRADHRAAVEAWGKEHAVPDFAIVTVNGDYAVGFTAAVPKGKYRSLEAIAAFRSALNPSLWRWVSVHRGRPYATPRNQGAEAKALYKSFHAIPMPTRIEALQQTLTGLEPLTDWMEGLTIHYLWLKSRKAGGRIVAIPYPATKKPNFKPLDGLVRAADQDALRDEYCAEEGDKP